MAKFSLTGFQTIIGIATGLATLAGATFTLMQHFKPAPTVGEMTAVVEDARSAKPVAGATIEVLTLQDAVVTTLPPTENGRARSSLKEGTYRLRVKHPGFADEVRQIQVLPGQSAEVRIALSPRQTGSGVDKAADAVHEGVGKVQKVLRGLGF